jgi:hypothetical protein
MHVYFIIYSRGYQEPMFSFLLFIAVSVLSAMTITVIKGELWVFYKVLACSSEVRPTANTQTTPCWPSMTVYFNKHNWCTIWLQNKTTITFPELYTSLYHQSCLLYFHQTIIQNKNFNQCTNGTNASVSKKV